MIKVCSICSTLFAQNDVNVRIVYGAIDQWKIFIFYITNIAESLNIHRSKYWLNWLRGKMNLIVHTDRVGKGAGFEAQIGWALTNGFGPGERRSRKRYSR
jgi:hypothetical protein